MNNIIHITQTELDGNEVNSADARDIHTYLKVDTPFPTWIKRAIEKYDFIEDEDFTSLITDSKSGKRDFFVSMDMAKELCMLENNQIGEDTRKYFIKLEKQSQKVLSIPEQIQLIAQGNQITDERLTILEKTKRLESWQEKSLLDAKNKKVYSLAPNDKNLSSGLHRKTWILFKRHFYLPRYNELPAVKSQEGLDFIESLALAEMV
ncbi:MAG: antA/AntB antirepressor family protein [Sulfurimonas sp.]|nr:antA/AntB antirepressor family protein [Sulfurimonas sp.]